MFDKQDENGQLLQEIELFNTSSINQNLTQFYNDKVGFQIEQQVQNQETKDSGWKFEKKNKSRKIHIHRTTELKDLSFFLNSIEIFSYLDYSK